MTRKPNHVRRRVRLKATTDGHIHVIEILHMGQHKCKVRILGKQHNGGREVWIERAILERHYGPAA